MKLGTWGRPGARVPGWGWGGGGTVRPGWGEGRGRGRMPRPPPHLARRGHGLALAPRPPRRGLPARPLRPDAAAGGESTQSLTLSLGNGCRKVPAAAISPSSRGVPGAVLKPATAPGELWGRPGSARDSRLTRWPGPLRGPPRNPTPPECGPSPSTTRPCRPSLWTFTREHAAQTRLRWARPPSPGSTDPSSNIPAATPPPSAQPLGVRGGGPEGGSMPVARQPHDLVTGPSPGASRVTELPKEAQGATLTHRQGTPMEGRGGRQGAHKVREAACGRGGDGSLAAHSPRDPFTW